MQHFVVVATLRSDGSQLVVRTKCETVEDAYETLQEYLSTFSEGCTDYGEPVSVAWVVYPEQASVRAGTFTYP